MQLFSQATREDFGSRIIQMQGMDDQLPCVQRTVTNLDRWIAGTAIVGRLRPPCGPKRSHPNKSPAAAEFDRLAKG